MGNNPKPQGAVQTGLESKKVSVWILILAVLITAALTYFGTTLTVSPQTQAQTTQSTQTTNGNSNSSVLSNEDLSKIELVYKTLMNGYVDKNISKDNLINGAL